MIIEGRGISGGEGEGRLLLLRKPFSFLGGVDPVTGRLTSPDGEGESIRGRVFAFPRGKGSTVGSYVFLELKRHGNLPIAIINESAEPIVATGAVMTGVPMVDGVDLSFLEEDDWVHVDGHKGRVVLPDVREVPVVTSILSHEERVLLLRRSEKVGSYRGKWACISGYLEGDEKPAMAARREIREEVGEIDLREISSTPVIHVRDGERMWSIHAFLFEVPSSKVRTDWEHVDHRWIAPEEVMDYEIVPGLVEVFKELNLLRS